MTESANNPNPKFYNLTSQNKMINFATVDCVVGYISTDERVLPAKRIANRFPVHAVHISFQKLLPSLKVSLGDVPSLPPLSFEVLKEFAVVKYDIVCF